MFNIKAFSLMVSVVLALGGCGGSGNEGDTHPNVQLNSITITPPNVKISVGSQAKLSAIGKYSDGNTQDLTAQVSWISQPTGIVSIDTQGNMTGSASGTTLITASFNGVSGETQATVLKTLPSSHLVSITITPSNLTIPIGGQKN